jgi:DNA-binding transcriptional LysR family regulator
MELLQLQYFQTVARLQHMTKAAEELNIGQPSLSKTIARLEEDLGVPLFDRQGRQIRLNQFGKVFLHRVERALMELETGKRELINLSGLDRGVISLAVSITSVLPNLLGSFLTQYPNVRFQQFLGSTVSMKHQLEQGEVDFCISSTPIQSPDIEWEPLFTEEIFLIVSTEHPLASRDEIHLKEVAHEPFISMNPRYGFRDLTDEFCRQAGFTPHIAFEGDEQTVLRELVKEGLGVAFTPALTLGSASSGKIKRLRIVEPTCQRTIGLARVKNRYLSKAAQLFHSFTIEYFSKLTQSWKNSCPRN